MNKLLVLIGCSIALLRFSCVFASEKDVWITSFGLETYKTTPLSIIEAKPIPYANVFLTVEDLGSVEKLRSLSSGLPNITQYSLRDAYKSALATKEHHEPNSCESSIHFYNAFWASLVSDDGVLKRFHNANLNLYYELVKNEYTTLSSDKNYTVRVKDVDDFMVEHYIQGLEQYVAASLSIVLDGLPLRDSFKNHGIEYNHEMSWVVLMAVAAYISSSETDIDFYVDVMKCEMALSE